MRVLGLGLRLLRLGGHRAWTAAALLGAGVAVGTALLAVALGAVHGWDAREARAGWRADVLPSVSDLPPGGAVASARIAVDRVDGRALALVDLVDPRPGAAPPPGFARMPAPGEVWVSPALAALLRELPADRLADRFPAAPTGEIGAAGLVAADELVAVVGRAGPVPGAVPVAGFSAATAEFGILEEYRQLTYVAVALLVFPVLSLVGASARLTMARRTERLALLRLLGASTGQVTVAAVAEVVLVTTVAAAAGVALQWLAAPALAAIELGGSGWYADDLRLPALVAAGVVVGAALLATAASVGGMRQVVVSPLGVVRRSRPGTARLVRLLGAAAGVAAFVVFNGARQGAAANITGLIFGVAVLALFGTVSLVGPLVVRLVGARLTRSARSPGRLLAGRRLLDDPRSAFRPLAGLVLAVFVAGFLAPLTAAVSGSIGVDDSVLVVRPPDAEPAALAREAAARLDALGIGARVTTDDSGALVEVGTAADRDRVRTALVPVAGGTPVVTEAEAAASELVFVTDLTRGVVIVLVGTFLVAATSAGTSAAARVLDQRRTLRMLRLAGTPLSVLDTARRAEVLAPLLVNGGIALMLGLLAASPFAAAADALSPSALVLLGSVLVVGVLLVVAASAASRPLLRSVTAGLGRDD